MLRFKFKGLDLWLLVLRIIDIRDLALRALVLRNLVLRDLVLRFNFKGISHKNIMWSE